MIHKQIKDEIKIAMKAKDGVKLRTIRGLVTAFTNEAVAQGGTPQDMINDEQALAVIKRLAKQRKDSIEQFQAGGREDLVKTEEEELAILEVYLPAMMKKEEIQKIAESKKAELSIEDKSQMGQFMGAVMKETKGQADGKDVKEIVESLLS